MKTRVCFSRKSDNWSTPKYLYESLHAEFCFTQDPCPLNAKFDGLEDSYSWFGNIFINPPYSNIKEFLLKGLKELNCNRAKRLVYLLPAKTDTRWFHDLVYKKAEIRFIKGRLKFGDSIYNAPFPSMIVIFKKEEEEKEL
jgi:site-specific DNA-methyltransferase (adenine-specific)